MNDSGRSLSVFLKVTFYARESGKKKKKQQIRNTLVKMYFMQENVAQKATMEVRCR